MVLKKLIEQENTERTKIRDRLQNQENNTQNRSSTEKDIIRNKNAKAEEFNELNEKCNREHQ